VVEFIETPGHAANMTGFVFALLLVIRAWLPNSWNLLSVAQWYDALNLIGGLCHSHPPSVDERNDSLIVSLLTSSLKMSLTVIVWTNSTIGQSCP